MSEIFNLTIPPNCSQIDLIRGLDEIGALRGDWNQLQLDVPDGFIEMPTLAWLCAWGLQQRQSGRRFTVRGKARGLNSLARLGLLSHLSIEHSAPSKPSTKGSYLPIMLIDDDQSVQQATNALCDLVLRGLDNAADFLPAFEWAINEIIDNIVIHAEADVPGAVCAHLYPNRQRLVVGICDAGQGILNSLSQSHVLATHQEALTKALERGITRSLEEGMGNGLAGSKQITQLNQGDFQL